MLTGAVGRVNRRRNLTYKLHGGKSKFLEEPGAVYDSQSINICYQTDK